MAYNVRVDPTTAEGAQPLELLSHLAFSEDHSLAGYDVDDYEAPMSMTPTPKKRKRPAFDDVDDGEPAEAGSPTPTQTKGSRGGAGPKKRKPSAASARGKKGISGAGPGGKSRVLRSTNNGTTK
jgi:hypothetical protein